MPSALFRDKDGFPNRIMFKQKRGFFFCIRVVTSNLVLRRPTIAPRYPVVHRVCLTRITN